MKAENNTKRIFLFIVEAHFYLNCSYILLSRNKYSEKSD